MVEKSSSFGFSTLLDTLKVDGHETSSMQGKSLGLNDNLDCSAIIKLIYQNNYYSIHFLQTLIHLILAAWCLPNALK